MSLTQYRRLTVDGLILVFILGVAIAFRLYRIDVFPAEFSYDEWQEAVDAEAMHTDGFQVFVPTNKGREALYTSLLSLLFYLWEPQDIVLRVAGASFGILAVGVSYFMSRELLRSVGLRAARWIAALSSLIFAINYWQIHLTRIGLRHTMIPLFAGLIFYFLWRGLNTGRSWAFLAAGLALGLSLYTYPAARFFLPMLILFFMLEAFVRRQAGSLTPSLWRQHRAGLIGMALVTGLVVTPLAAYFLFQRPELFLFRANEISVLNDNLNNGSPPLALGDSLISNLGGLAFHGDDNSRFNLPGRPIFDPILAAALLLGLIIALKRVRQPPYLFLLVWFAAMLMPAVLVHDVVPSFKRLVGLAPGLFILPALAWVTLIATLVRHSRRRPWRARLVQAAAVSITLLFMVILGGVTYRDYFLRWGPSHPQYEYAQAYEELAHTMRAKARSDELWLFPLDLRNPIPRYYRLNGLAEYGDLPPHHFLRIDEQTMFDDLNQAVQGYQRVVLVRFKIGQEWEADHKAVLPFLLEKYGSLVGAYSNARYELEYYELNQPIANLMPGQQWQPVETVFGSGLKLIAAAYGDASGQSSPDRLNTPSGSKIWTALQWQRVGPINQDLSVSLRLLDPSGQVVTQVDRPLYDRWHQPSSGWQNGEDYLSYHLLDTQSGLVPDDYQLVVTVYNTADQTSLPGRTPAAIVSAPSLGMVDITPALVPSTPIGQAFDILPGAEQIRLLKIERLPDQTLIPGDSFPLSLTWQPTRPIQKDLSLHLCLEKGQISWPILDHVLMGSDDYPTSRWRQAEAVQQWLKIELPRQLPGGSYQLTLCSKANDEELTLGAIRVQGRSPQFRRPADLQYALNTTFGNEIRLLGGKLDRTNEGILRLDLYWQALGTMSQSYKVFVHILDESGQIIAQNDQIPANGEAPTTSWLPGEVVTDRHQFTLQAGSYQIAIGLYNPQTGQRLDTPNVADDRLLLPKLRF